MHVCDYKLVRKVRLQMKISTHLIYCGGTLILSFKCDTVS